jgi:two-component system cell cycle sensor histidine kinase/response regulator CckA
MCSPDPAQRGCRGVAGAVTPVRDVEPVARGHEMTVGSVSQDLENAVGREQGETLQGPGRSLGRWAAGIVGVVGASELAGRWHEHPLVAGFPGALGMRPLTAICFLVAAGSLLLLCAERASPVLRLAGRAGGAVLICAASIGGTARSGVMGDRVAPTTALAFTLAGLAMILVDYRTGQSRRPATALAMLVGGLAFVVTFGYAYDAWLLSDPSAFVPMSLGSAICFLVLSVGLVSSRSPSGMTSLLTGSGPGSVLARRLLPAVIAIPVVLGWLRFKGEEFGLYDSGAGVALLAAGMMLIMGALTWWSAVSLDRNDLARSRAERQLQELNDGLEARVAERTSELARANETLLDQTRFLNQVIDTNPQLVFVKDWSGRFTLANKAVADLYGTTVAHLIGRTDADFNSNAGEVRAFVEADREVMSKRRVKVIPEEPVTSDQGRTVRWFHTIKTPLVGRDGSCTGVLGLSTDVTARHHAERELRRASDELRTLFDASPLAICSLTSDGYVRSWNPAAERLFGWTAGDVIGRPLPIVPPELTEEYREFRERVLAGKPATNVETCRRRKDGALIDVSISTAALHDATGKVDGVAAIFVDIRDRKVLEAQLRQAQKMEAVGQLAGGIAHDFNNLLTIIRTASELLLTDIGPDDARRDDIEEIEEAAQRAASLTRQLLAFSRQQVLEPQVVNLNRVVAELEPMARRLVEENIRVMTCLADDLHPVVADRNQLDQVILNLVVNARDAMPDGGTLRIETSNVVLDDGFSQTHPTARSGPHVLLSVTDTGCGMDTATQARIFDPFFTTKPVGLGTGLGLATVYGIVKQSGGHIYVSSEVGRGACFMIYLPRGTGVEDEAAPVRSRQAPPEAEADGDGATILVVEDDSAVRSSVCRLLERRGYEVMASRNGQQALALLAESEQAVDLVISDIVMPEMSGLELRDRLKTLMPAVPVLLMSGYSQEAITRLGNHESLGPLIEKPFTVASLLENVRSVLHG